MAHKKFNKKVISENELRYEAWFPEETDYYIIENVLEGYKVRHENIGVHAGETDRCYNGGTIINYRVPQTGDEAQPALWIAFVLAGAAMLGGVIFSLRRKADK